MRPARGTGPVKGFEARLVDGIVWVRLDMGLGRREWIAVGRVTR